MLNRKANISDFWRHLKERKGFKHDITRIVIDGQNIMDTIVLDINSALTIICGKNGAGKTTILRAIFSILRSKDAKDNFYEPSSSYVAFNEKSNKSSRLYGSVYNTFQDVLYLEPAEDAIIIKNTMLNDSTFFEDYIDVGEESSILDDYLGYIKKILSNDIERVSVIEIEGLLDNDKILPYFQVYKSGTKYGTSGMGQGEHKVLYLLWSLLTVKPGSIVLLEEPEAFLCSKSQEYLMDFIACIIDSKKIHIFLSTHSGNILKKQNVGDCLIVKRNNRDKICLTSEKDKSKYLSALGLEPIKKGILLVEDDFAKLVVHTILNYNNSSLLQEYYIDQLGGESHILQVATHYKSKSMKIVCLLDADQKGKLKEEQYLIPITYLPAKGIVAPEEEIISYIKNNQERLAKSIALPDEQALAEIRAVEENHHDWFNELSTALNLNSESLKVTAISLWIEDNKESISKFLHMLETLGNQITRKIEKNGDEHVIYSEGIEYNISPELKKQLNLDFYLGKRVKGNLKFSRGKEVFCFDM